jgi:hypothetical protein
MARIVGDLHTGKCRPERGHGSRITMTSPIACA